MSVNEPYTVIDYKFEIYTFALSLTARYLRHLAYSTASSIKSKYVSKFTRHLNIYKVKKDI